MLASEFNKIQESLTPPLNAGVLRKEVKEEGGKESDPTFTLPLAAAIYIIPRSEAFNANNKNETLLLESNLVNNNLKQYVLKAVYMGYNNIIRKSKGGKKEMIVKNKKYEKYGIIKPDTSMTFDSFNIEPDLQVAFTVCKNYAKTFKYTPNFGSDAGNLFLIDRNPGVGKTHLACAIANELAGRSISGTMLYMPDFVANVTSDIDNPEGDLPDIKRMLISTPLLIMDKMGSEDVQPDKWQLTQLYKIIHARVAYYKPIIITTRYHVDELAKKYGSEIMRYLEDTATVVYLYHTVHYR